MKALNRAQALLAFLIGEAENIIYNQNHNDIHQTMSTVWYVISVLAWILIWRKRYIKSKKKSQLIEK